MNFIAIVEARTGSKRLPNKVMMKLNTKEVILYLVDRLKLSKKINKIVVATTEKKKDDKLVNLLKKQNIEYFRGSENNVLKRVYFAAKKYKADNIVEISGDSPLIDPKIIDDAIKFLKINNHVDYLNVDHGLPGGIGFEIIKFMSLKKSYQFSTKKYEKEHVTPYIIKNPRKFNSFYFIANKKLKYPMNLSFLLDEKEDYLFLQKITSLIKKNFFDTFDLIKIIKKKKINLTNKLVKRNRVYYK